MIAVPSVRSAPKLDAQARCLPSKERISPNLAPLGKKGGTGLFYSLCFPLRFLQTWYRNRSFSTGAKLAAVRPAGLQHLG